MTVSTTLTRVSRAIDRLEQLGRIGRRDGDGITRPGLGVDEQRAAELVASWMAADGLEVSWDSVGNLYGRAPGSEPGAREVWSGSHLDTVPNGGRFDGALGVLVALEAVGALAVEQLPCPLRVVVFRDEEGWRFGGGCLGSRVASGQIEASDLAATDAEGISVSDALAELGYPPPALPVALPQSFVEVHIEQGPVLEGWGIPHAAVTAISGMVGYSITFHGASGHAGTVPMADRQDAFLAAAEFGLRLREATLRHPGAVVTLGDIRISDSAPNIVPGEVRVSVDVRAPTLEAWSALADAGPAMAIAAAGRHRCHAEVRCTWRSPPVDLAERVRDAIHGAASALEIPLIDLPSGAGHDAGVLAAAGVESGMVFVRSLNRGASHRPDELTGDDDVASAIAVLTETLRALAGRASVA